MSEILKKVFFSPVQASCYESPKFYPGSIPPGYHAQLAIREGDATMSGPGRR